MKQIKFARLSDNELIPDMVRRFDITMKKDKSSLMDI